MTKYLNETWTWSWLNRKRKVAEMRTVRSLVSWRVSWNAEIRDRFKNNSAAEGAIGYNKRRKSHRNTMMKTRKSWGDLENGTGVRMSHAWKKTMASKYECYPKLWPQQQAGGGGVRCRMTERFPASVVDGHHGEMKVGEWPRWTWVAAGCNLLITAVWDDIKTRGCNVRWQGGEVIITC